MLEKDPISRPLTEIFILYFLMLLPGQTTRLALIGVILDL